MTVNQLLNALQQVPMNQRDIEVRIETNDLISVTPAVAWFRKDRDKPSLSTFVIEVIQI